MTEQQKQNLIAFAKNGGMAGGIKWSLTTDQRSIVSDCYGVITYKDFFDLKGNLWKTSFVYYNCLLGFDSESPLELSVSIIDVEEACIEALKICKAKVLKLHDDFQKLDI